MNIICLVGNIFVRVSSNNVTGCVITEPTNFPRIGHASPAVTNITFHQDTMALSHSNDAKNAQVTSGNSVPQVRIF